MQTANNPTQGRPLVKLFAMLLAAAFMVTAVAIAPAGAKHDRDDEGEWHGDDWHHEHKEHHKHWHEYGEHVYHPPPVVYAPPPESYAPPPPVVYAPPAPSISFVIPVHIH